MKTIFQKIMLMLLAILPFVTFAQPSQEKQILLNTGSFVPAKNVGALTFQSADLLQSKGNNKHYVVMQFSSLPNEQEKQNLKQNGIELLEYLPKDAYTAIVSSSANLSSLQSNKVQSVFALKPQQKAFSQVLAGDALPHAIKIPGFVDVNVLNYEVIARSIMQEAVASIGGSIIEQTDVFKNYTLRVPKSKVGNIASLPFVQWIEFIDPPLQPENLLGRSLHRVNVLQDGVRNLKGDGMNIGIFDEVASPHLDFSPAGRLTIVDANGAGSHGTHVSGTVGGKGIINPLAKGMAPNANIISYYGFSGDVQARMAVEIPARTLISSNHSYHDGLGVQCGVNGASAGYSLRARNTDINLNNFNYHLHCHSSGNAQTSCASGWGTITGAGKAAKNNFVVGNITTAESLSGSSSCGPVHDGRVKPEIVAMGTSVLSTYTPLNTYGTISGTSMSTPGMTGTVALLAQRYKQLNSNVLPPSALIKNIVCNTAFDLGNVGPDYRFGFGRVNALKAVKILETNRYVLDNVTTGQTKDIIITVPANATKLNVMLTWNDPAANALAATALVNNLDATVINGATTHLPWILNPIAPADPATRAVDNVSNIEQITINNPAAGTYTLRVAGTSVPQGANQTYAITWDIETPGIEVIYPNGSEKFNPSGAETITWDNAGVTGTQTVEYSLDGGSNWSAIGTVAANVTRLPWTIPAGLNTSTARIRVSAGGLTDMSDNNFSILGLTTGFAGNGTSCVAGTVNFTWNATVNATHYDILMLNSATAEFAPVATNVVGTSTSVTGLTPGQSTWFSIVSKNNTTNSVSERSNAINVTVSNGGGGIGAVGTISGQSSVCGATSGLVYSIAAVTGATSYNWTVPTGATIVAGQNTTSITVNYGASATSGNVAVTASNGSCSAVPRTLAIGFGGGNLALPTSGGDRSANLCAGQSVPTLTATATAPNGATVKWYSAPSGGLVVTNPILNSVGTITYYAATVENGSLCESPNRTPVVLTITQVPAGAASAQGATTFCAGRNVTLNATGGGSYLWSNGATTQGITVNTAGNYTCTITNNGCVTNTAAINVVVNALPIATASAAGPTTFCQPNTVTLTASAGTSYAWSNGANTRSITAASSGNYSVIVTDANGCSSLATSAIAVVANPQPTASLAAFPYTKLLPGIGTSLNATVAPAGTYTYVWTKDGSTIANANTAGLTVTLDKLGSYSVTATNAGGCSHTSNIVAISDSASSKLFILPNPNGGKFDVVYHSTNSNNYTVKVFDAKGAQVYSKNHAIGLPYQRLSVDIRNAGKGVFVVAIFNNANVRMATGRVVLQ